MAYPNVRLNNSALYIDVDGATSGVDFNGAALEADTSHSTLYQLITYGSAVKSGLFVTVGQDPSSYGLGSTGLVFANSGTFGGYQVGIGVSGIGASFYNENSASISGTAIGFYAGYVAVVVNRGTISGGTIGVEIGSGFITNLVGLISGGAGAIYDRAAEDAQVQSFGTLRGSSFAVDAPGILASVTLGGPTYGLVNVGNYSYVLIGAPSSIPPGNVDPKLFAEATVQTASGSKQDALPALSVGEHSNIYNERSVFGSIYELSGNVTNTGTISMVLSKFVSSYTKLSYPIADSAAVLIEEGGSLLNAGAVYGAAVGVALTGTGGNTVMNSGKIEAIGGSLGLGSAVAIDMPEGGYVKTTGTILAFGITSAAGIVLGGGSVNQSSGTISATTQSAAQGAASIGVELTAGGTLSVAGNIDAGTYGIFAYGGLTTIGPSGTISSIQNAGSINIRPGGTIIAGTGIDFSGSTTTVSGGTTTILNPLLSGTVNTYGVIDGAAAYGVLLRANDVLDNETGGTVTGSRIGVLGLGTPVSVVNDSRIGGGVGIDLFAGGQVTNTGSSAVVAATGNQSVGVELLGSGTIDNAGGATISGAIGAVAASASGQTIINASLSHIEGNSDGVYLAGGANGLLQNAGDISAAHYGVVAATNETVRNAGLIQVGNSHNQFYGVAVVLDGGGYLYNAGPAQSGASQPGTIAGLVAGVDVQGGRATVVNAGTIDGVADSALGQTGAGVEISGTAALVLINTATIDGSTFGIYAGTLATAGAPQVTIDNSGVINAPDDRYGIDLRRGADVTNSGSIGSDIGVNTNYATNLRDDYGLILAYGTVTNAASGVIYGMKGGVDGGADTTLVNYGIIGSGYGDAVQLGAAASVTLHGGGGFRGAVVAGTSSGSTLVLDTPGTVTLAALSPLDGGFAYVEGAGKYNFAAAGFSTIVAGTGVSLLLADGSLSSQSLIETSGPLVNYASLGTVSAAASVANFGSIAALTLASGQTLLNGQVVAGGTTLTGTIGQVVLGNAGTFTLADYGSIGAIAEGTGDKIRLFSGDVTLNAPTGSNAGATLELTGVGTINGSALSYTPLTTVDPLSVWTLAFDGAQHAATGLAATIDDAGALINEGDVAGSLNIGEAPGLTGTLASFANTQPAAGKASEFTGSVVLGNDAEFGNFYGARLSGEISQASDATFNLVLNYGTIFAPFFVYEGRSGNTITGTTVAGASTTAIDLSAEGGTVVLGQDALAIGNIVGDGTHSVLQLAGPGSGATSTAAGTLSGVGIYITGFNQIVEQGYGAWNAQYDVFGQGTSFVSYGGLALFDDVVGGKLLNVGTALNVGDLYIAGGTFENYGVLLNEGLLSGSLTLGATGYLYNTSRAADVGTISGSVYAEGQADVVNAGSIKGGVTLEAPNSILALLPGGTIAGPVVAATAVTGGVTTGSTLDLGVLDSPSTIVSGSNGPSTIAGTVIAGTLSGLGSHYEGFTAIQEELGAAWYLTGVNRIGAGVTLTNGGALIAEGSLANGGILLGSFSVTDGAFSNTGTVLGRVSALRPSGEIDNAGSIASTIASIAAVVQFDGGTINQYAGGRITGGAYGVYGLASGDLDLVSNAGLIDSAVGVYLGLTQGATASLVNSGTIEGTSGTAVEISGGPAHIVNTGTVLGRVSVLRASGEIDNAGSIASTIASIAAVVQFDGGTINQYAGGQITGGAYGVYGLASGDLALVSNAGLIDSAVGVYLGLTQGATASLVNSGTIEGTSGTAVEISGGPAHIVVSGTGTFDGEVALAAGQTGLSNELEWNATRALNGLESQYANVTFVAFDGTGQHQLGSFTLASGGLTIGGNATLGAGATLTNAGSVGVSGGLTLANAAVVINDGTISGSGGRAIYVTGASSDLVVPEAGTFVGGVGFAAGGSNELDWDTSRALNGLETQYANVTDLVFDLPGPTTLGGFTLSSGALTIQGNASLTGPLYVGAGATLDLPHGTLGGVVSVASTGSIDLTGGQLDGSLTLDGPSTRQLGGILLAAGSLAIQAAGIGLSSLSVASAGYLALSSSAVTLEGQSNTVAGEVAGSAGITLASGVTLTNSGTIVGEGGTAVSALGGPVRVVVAADGTFVGGVDLATNAGSELDWDTSRALNGLETQYAGVTDLVLGGPSATALGGFTAPVGVLTIHGDASLTTPVYVGAGSTLVLPGGTLTGAVSVSAGGLVDLAGGYLGGHLYVEGGAVTVSGGELGGSIAVDAGATLALLHGTLDAAVHVADGGRFNRVGGQIYGSLTFDGPGTQNLRGIALASGSLTIEAAGLKLPSYSGADALSVGSTGSLTLLSSAVTLYGHTNTVDGLVTALDGITLSAGQAYNYGGTIRYPVYTLVNSGTIIGEGGTAVSALPGPVDVVVESQGTFGGMVDLPSGFAEELQWESSRPLDGLLTQYVNVTDVVLGGPSATALGGFTLATGALTIQGSGSLSSPLVVKPGATLDLTGGAIGGPIVVDEGGAVALQGETLGGTLLNGGTVINLGGSSVLADASLTNYGVLLNEGSLVGNVTLGSGGVLDDAVGQTLTGSITATGPAAIYDAGPIDGAVSFEAPGNKLALQPSGTITGLVSAYAAVGSGGLDGNVLALYGGGAAVGTLTGLGSHYTGFTTLGVASGASWLLTGGIDTSLVAEVVNYGSLTVAAAGGLTLNGEGLFTPTIENAGLITGAYGTAVSGMQSAVVAVAGSGTFGGEVALAAGVPNELVWDSSRALYGLESQYANITALVFAEPGTLGGFTLSGSGLAITGTVSLSGNVHSSAGAQSLAIYGSLSNPGLIDVSGSISLHGSPAQPGFIDDGGTIRGDSGTAVSAAGPAHLVIGNGATFIGAVLLAAGAPNELEWQSSAPLYGLETTYANVTDLVFDTPGALGGFTLGSGALSISGSASLIGPAYVATGATIDLYGALTGALSGDGTLLLEPGASFYATGVPSFGGSVLIGSGATYAAASGVGADTVTLAGGDLDAEPGGVTLTSPVQVQGGTISGSVLSLAAGGTLTAGTLVNVGALSGSLSLAAGGALDNLAGGTIAGTIDDSGSGIYNQAGASISGSIYGFAPVTIDDAGLISAQLSLAAGSVFTLAQGGSLSSTTPAGVNQDSTLVLAASASGSQGQAGYAPGLGNTYGGFGQYAISPGAAWYLNGATLTQDATLTDSGIAAVGLGDFTVGGLLTGSPGASAVEIDRFGTLLVAASGTIDLPVEDFSGAGLLINAGTIADGTPGVFLGYGLTGASFVDGGRMTNASGGLITANIYGVEASGGAFGFALYNSGTIEGGVGVSVTLSGGQTAVIENSGYIQGNPAVSVIGGAAQVTVGSGGRFSGQVLLAPGYANELVWGVSRPLYGLETQYSNVTDLVFSSPGTLGGFTLAGGALSISGAATLARPAYIAPGATLALYGTLTGSLTGQGALLLEPGSEFDATGSPAFAGSVTIGTAATYAAAGGTGPETVTLDGGNLLVPIQGETLTNILAIQGGTISGDIDNAGLIEASAGTLVLAGVASGNLRIDAYSTLDLAGGEASGTVAFGGDATLQIGDADSSSGLLMLGFFKGDVIDLQSVAYVDGSTNASFDSDTGQLVVDNGQQSVTLSFGAGNTAVDDPFHVTSDGKEGIFVTNDAVSPCYCPGTLIATGRGEVAIETLRRGDTVLTADGASEPIRWIGRRSYDGRFIRGNLLMLPVTIRAGALADGVPHADLTVSPGHAMWIDGHLIPAWRLVNGVTITQAAAVDSVTYIHVELRRHAVIFANGAPAESYLDEGGFRGQFQNAAEFRALYPEAPAMAPLQARLEDGFALQHIQDRLIARAGLIPPVEPAGRLRGYVDQAGPERVCGWAQDVDSPEEPVALEISVGGAPALCVLANGWRADLRQAGLGSGCHAFDVRLPEGRSGSVTVRRASDGALLDHTSAAAGERQVA